MRTPPVPMADLVTRAYADGFRAGVEDERVRWIEIMRRFSEFLCEHGGGE